MERLDSYDFNARPSRSRYAAAVKALVEEGVKAVRLKRGEDFPEDIKTDSVQGGIRDQFKKAGHPASVKIEDDNNIVVLLQETNGNGRARRGRRREAVAS